MIGFVGRGVHRSKTGPDRSRGIFRTELGRFSPDRTDIFRSKPGLVQIGPSLDKSRHNPLYQLASPHDSSAKAISDYEKKKRKRKTWGQNAVWWDQWWEWPKLSSLSPLENNHLGNWIRKQISSLHLKGWIRKHHPGNWIFKGWREEKVKMLDFFLHLPCLCCVSWYLVN